MLTEPVLERILTLLPRWTIAVVGDLFLDRYLDLDAALTEPSLETGLPAYQVVQVRSYPGAAGTVLNNLVALGAGTLLPVAVVGDDGEGYELRQALLQLGRVDLSQLFNEPGRRTPTYTKPMLCPSSGPARELSRLDIKNRTPLLPEAQERLCAALDRCLPKVDAVLVLDQVSEAECGVITSRVRGHLQGHAERSPETIYLADSRERIGLFRSMTLKPNEHECRKALAGETGDLDEMVGRLAQRNGRPVFCTCGAEGMRVAEPKAGRAVRVPAAPVTGPIDIVGAGDSSSAALAAALLARATLTEAAAFANLVASITIQQLGTTGTATPDQVRRRFRETHA